MNTIIENIILPSKFLSKNLKQNILFELCKKEKLCNPIYGYVYKIYDDITILDSIVSVTTSESVFTVKYKFDSIKPELNKVYVGLIVAVYNQGLFVTIGQELGITNFQALILQGEYDENAKRYSFSCGCSFGLNEFINVKLINILFKKKFLTALELIVALIITINKKWKATLKKIGNKLLRKKMNLM